MEISKSGYKTEYTTYWDLINKEQVSPYFGAVVGMGMLSELGETYTDIYFGGLIGVEIVAVDFLCLYAEYALTVIFRESPPAPGIEIDLGISNLPSIGVIIYFN